MLIDKLGLLLFANIMLISFVYVYLIKVRKLIGFHLGTNLATMLGGSLAIVTGVILIYQFPLQFVFVTMVTTLLGMSVGALIGALFDYQALLTGYANGLMMGIMSPMVGAAAKNSYLFLAFIEMVFIFSLFLFILSVRQS